MNNTVSVLPNECSGAIDYARNLLHVHEGVRRLPYVCSANKLTIGVGRNLEDRGLSEDEIELLFSNDVKIAENDARFLVPVFDKLCAERQAVILDMVFNLGRSRFAKFVKFIDALCDWDFDHASEEMLDSRWAKQVGKRAKRLAEIMKTGKFSDKHYRIYGIT